ncbi:MAG: hypothetical protein Unbinned6805contig1000_4 [Prokaryotic dsDNA virus sp.]|nr:MAG: hypothetical protein Unbinned6805contig1000_4 [Prokaryotic dsDNA virus sp.]|tara:strand:+ start:13922 stop:14293 length:372 start_codon:yes stop_codon:yes gene_type:complete
MWGTIVGAIGSIFTSWVDLKKSKNDSEAARYRQAAQVEGDWDLEALRASQYSWKDELITIVWFSPLVVGWFRPDLAFEWVGFVSELPVWYQFGMFGIMAASFGLRWYFKQQGFKVGGKGNGVN